MRVFLVRPVAAGLLMCAIALAGLAGFLALPVAPLPQVEFPTIMVQANLPGAAPEVMASTVAAPLERSLGFIAGVSEMTSSSALGSTRIVLQFELGRSIDGAARDVQAAINAAQGNLPVMPSRPTYRKMNPADAPILMLALTSDVLSRAAMYDSASTILAQKISQISGVGQVTVGGGSMPAVRVEIDPLAAASNNISMEDVRIALSTNSSMKPKGYIEKGQTRWQLTMNDQLSNAQEYERVIVSYKNGAAVRVGDIGVVKDSVQDLRNDGKSDGLPATVVMVFKQPGSNILETIEELKRQLPSLKADMPEAIKLSIVMDRSLTIKSSIKEMTRTLMISTLLVMIVVWIFLKDIRAALIPGISVPISLMGTFAGMWLFDFSIDNLSLMALIVATGFVVDDAIVVLENISRHRARGKSAFRAALKGLGEIKFTVMSISVSLVAVFLPILMMTGIIGRLFSEFAITLTMSILISAFVSLAATPVMCSKWLTKEVEEYKAPRWYMDSLGWALRHRVIMSAMLIGVIALNISLFASISKGFFPQQDTGRIMGGIKGDQSMSFQAMKGKMSEFGEIVGKDVDVEHTVVFTGGGQANSGNMFVTLKQLSDREDKASADEIIARLRKKIGKQSGAELFLQSAQEIRMGGRSSAAQYQYTIQAALASNLKRSEPKAREALKELKELADVNTDQQDRGISYYTNINRDAAIVKSIGIAQIDGVLNDSFGQRQVASIFGDLNQYRVILSAQEARLGNPLALNDIYLSGRVPLNEIAVFEQRSAALSLNHQGLAPSSTISFNLAPGVALSEAALSIKKLSLPDGVYGSFQGTAKAFQDTAKSQPMLIGLAILAMYLILGILYESLIHPLTILSTLPSAGLGALLALNIFKSELNIMSLIGILLLIGIVKKNAIMMVDYAIKSKKPAQEAITEACALRFRPIMMTTITALLGALPLALGWGDGFELRQPLGISIVGGLVASQILTLYTTPVVYTLMDSMRSKRNG